MTFTKIGTVLRAMDHQAVTAWLALLIACGSFSWRVYDHIIGADIEFIMPQQVTITCRSQEYRDVIENKKTVTKKFCRDNSDIVIIGTTLTFINNGAPQYNDVVRNIEVDVQYSTNGNISEKSTMYMQYFADINTRISTETIAQPFLVQGRSVESREIKFYNRFDNHPHDILLSEDEWSERNVRLKYDQFLKAVKNSESPVTVTLLWRWTDENYGKHEQRCQLVTDIGIKEQVIMRGLNLKRIVRNCQTY